RETGCYADFTLPSAPSETQTRRINSIYYATDDPVRPKSHDDGVAVAKSRPPSGDLMIIQGPLTLNWQRRKLGIFPKVENGEIAYHNPASRQRIRLWIDQAISVEGAEELIFIKVHTHGAQDRNIRALLRQGGLARLYEELESICKEEGYRLHYVTAYELFQAVKAIERTHAPS
ncbi:MAG: hypothetical protein AB1515_03755, partial [Nitrospirota bacterium]